ncbi:MAG: hypothetical protein GY708_29780 [Actinomycetia bacterium]|nr:hypothetical protein [Actinomycetes bacterium]MCP4962219.1 hypothetical protein [Actinomycetes bacterium]
MKSWGPAFIASAVITIGCLVFSFVTNTIITTIGNDPVGDYNDADHGDDSDHSEDEDHSDDGDHSEEGLGVIFVD